MVESRPAMFRLLARSAPALSILLALAASGCGTPAGSPDRQTLSFSQLRGSVFGGAGELVVPGSGWEPFGDGDWRFEGKDGLVFVSLDRPLERDATFVFESPAGVTLRASWNEVELATSPGSPAGHLEVTVPRRELAGGRHRLRLRLLGERGKPAVGKVLWRAALGTAPRASAGFDRQAGLLLAQFLDLGLAGSDAAPLHDGFVTLGPWTARVELDHDRGGTFVAFVAGDAATSGRVSASIPGAPGADIFLGEAADDATRPVLLRLQVPAGTRRLDLAVSQVAAGTPVLWGGPYYLPSRRRVPTVVLLTLDTTRRDALGAFGGPSGATPNLDRLAAGATVFTRASSTTSWTLPSHASIFTGLYPAEHGAGVSRDRIARSFETLAERLSRRYVTSAFVGGALLRQRYGTGQGFGVYLVPPQWELPGRTLVDGAIDLLAAAEDLPLFLFVNLFDAHYPYLPPEDSPLAADLAAAIEKIPPGSPWRNLLGGEIAAWSRLIDGEIPHEAAGVAAMKLAYRAEVLEVDRLVGQLLDELERRGRLDGALVVVAADHGEFLGEKGFFSHSSRLEPELVDIPMIVKFPGQREAARVDAPVSLIDLFPTILEATGFRPPAGHGISLTQVAPLAARPGVQFEETEHWVHPLPKSMKVAVSIHGFDGELGRRIGWDAGEECHDGQLPWRNTVRCSEEVRAAHEKMRQALEARVRRAARKAVEAAELDEAERARLEALGYL